MLVKPNHMTALMTSATRGISITPTAAELAAGRFMRAPDHDAGAGGDGDAGADGAGDGSGSDGGSDAGSQGADGASGESDTSLLGGASDTGAGGADKDGDGKVQDGADDKGADGDGEQGKDEEPNPDDSVPAESYKLEPITVGEGDDAQTIEIDSKLLEEVTPALKEAGITQGAAKKLAPVVLRVQEQVMAKLGDEHAALKADWEKQAREDKDIGGAKMDETLALAGRALDTFGAKSVKDDSGKETNEFRLLLNETGLGDHPVMLKMFREVGKLVGEDGDLIRPDNSPGGKSDRLEVLYPDDVPK